MDDYSVIVQVDNRQKAGVMPYLTVLYENYFLFLPDSSDLIYIKMKIPYPGMPDVKLSSLDKEALSHILMTWKSLHVASDYTYLAKQRFKPLTKQEKADQDLYEKKLGIGGGYQPNRTSEETEKLFNMLLEMRYTQLAVDSFRAGGCWKCNRQTELLEARSIYLSGQ